MVCEPEIMGGTTFNLDLNPDGSPFSRYKVVIVLFCSDSRNTTPKYYDAKREIIEIHSDGESNIGKERTHVDFVRLNEPGAFMSPHMIFFIKEIMKKKFEFYSIFKKPIDFEVHVVSHGNIAPASGDERGRIYKADELIFHEKCCTNCGMMGAQSAAEKLPDLIVYELQPCYSFEEGGVNQKIKIDSHDKLREYMLRTYAGYGAQEGWQGGILDWLKNIDNIITHPGAQLDALKKSIDSDDALMGLLRRDLSVKTTINYFPNVLNYGGLKLYQIDGFGNPHDEVLQSIFEKIMESGKLPPNHEYMLEEQSKRKPLLAIGDYSLPAMREIACKCLVNPDYEAGSVFSIALPHAEGPFGINAFFGTYYSLEKLGGREKGKIAFVGKNENDAVMFNQKFAKDVLCNALARDLTRVNLTPLSKPLPAKALI